MKGFWKSSVGKKLIMSLSGIFLMLFLLMHLSINLTMLIDPVKAKHTTKRLILWQQIH
jgi:hypothetical protein